MDDTALNTRQKALALNLEATTYGTFAEIGAGQEVARWFFSAGGAAGTVAKTISAYDMAVSDAALRPDASVMSADSGCEAMLDQRVQLNCWTGSASERGDDKSVLRLRRHRGDAQLSRQTEMATAGWGFGSRRDPPRSHPRSSSTCGPAPTPTALAQQEALGILGVNLVHGAFHRSNPS